jgi:outer membrane protein assembly factor BamB
MKTVFLSVSALIYLVASLSAGDWPAFRGPTADGVAPADEKPPLKWSETENLIWRTELPGPGSSSPIVIGDRVFLSCYSGYGADKINPGDVSQLQRHALCLDRATGKILWNEVVKTTIAEKPYQGEYITTHGYASSTPVSDGKGIFFFFAHAGVHAYTLEGKKVWETSVGTRPHDWGAGSSPILYGDLLIVNAALESDTLFALDRKTGKEVWSVKGFPASWNTPTLAKVGEREELIVNASGKLRAFDPKTGAELWSCQSIRAAELCPSVLVHDGVCFVIGHPGGEAMAVKAGGSGDVSQTNVLWRIKKGSNVGSPVWLDGHLYFSNDSRGIAYCLKADTGETVYEQKLSETARDRYYASPVLSQGRLYYLGRTGGTVVLAAKPQFEVLATNIIADDKSVANASPALAGGRLFMRSDRFAYCFGEK